MDWTKYQNTTEWADGVPEKLHAAIKQIRKDFEWAHWSVGLSTQILCYAYLHNFRHPQHSYDELMDYAQALPVFLNYAGPTAINKYKSHIAKKTVPASFAAFYNLYIDAMTAQAEQSFKELLQIGKANESPLGQPHLAWALSQTKHLVRAEMHMVRTWIYEACDRLEYRTGGPVEGGEYDYGDTVEEYEGRWRAPKFLMMKPVHFGPYDPSTVWERFDEKTTLSLRSSFAEMYVIQVEGAIKDAAGAAEIELAKTPPVDAEVSPGSDKVSVPLRIEPSAPKNRTSIRNVRMYETYLRMRDAAIAKGGTLSYEKGAAAIFKSGEFPGIVEDTILRILKKKPK